ncbi:MAG TPA: MFS transporter [Candidatus Dormibacteraeota bacterium]|nr:MFS transporter [Candidatus Dormibacteraeota bacterium]
MGRDYRLLLLVRLLRSFGFGFIPVLLGLRFEERGLGAGSLGVALAIAVLAAALSGLPLAALASRLGRRPVLTAIGLLMAITGVDIALATQPALLVLAGVTGMLGASGADLGPFLAIEQAALVDSVPDRRRNRAFGRYSLTGGLAIAAGGLVASLGTSPGRVELLFLVFAALGVLAAAISLLLSPQVAAAAPGPIISRSSARPLAGLAALFGLDALGGGLVLQTVIAYWLHIRFGAGSGLLGPSFALIALVQAGSYEVASRLADRIGLVRTMVFTHLPSNVLLMLVPFSPNLAVALVLLTLRFSIAQMDVPARQAYVASIVPPAERAGALALMGTVRGVMQAVGPLIAGFAIQAAAAGLPFLLAGGLKISYDLGLYAAFARRPGGHEIPREPPES